LQLVDEVLKVNWQGSVVTEVDAVEAQLVLVVADLGL
jgi:hypothetical protein